MNEQPKKKMALTKLEKFWILYDVANSAFVLLVSTLLPIYFNSLAEADGMAPSDYLAWWGYGASAATLIVAFLGPVLGTIADTKGLKKPLFLSMILIGAVGCAALGLFSHWITFLIVYIVAKAAYSGSLVLYDAMLTDVTTPERMDHVSSQGYGWGYIGSCIPFLIGLGLVLGADAIGLSMGTAMVITFILIAVWWVALSLPLLRRYRQIYYVERPKHVIRSSFSRMVPPCGRSVNKNTFSCFCWPSFSTSTVCTPLLIWRRRMAMRWALTAPSFCWRCWPHRWWLSRLRLSLGG